MKVKFDKLVRKRIRKFGKNVFKLSEGKVRRSSRVAAYRSINREANVFAVLKANAERRRELRKHLVKLGLSNVEVKEILDDGV